MSSLFVQRAIGIEALYVRDYSIGRNSRVTRHVHWPAGQSGSCFVYNEYSLSTFACVSRYGDATTPYVMALNITLFAIYVADAGPTYVPYCIVTIPAVHQARDDAGRVIACRRPEQGGSRVDHVLYALLEPLPKAVEARILGEVAFRSSSTWLTGAFVVGAGMLTLAEVLLHGYPLKLCRSDKQSHVMRQLSIAPKRPCRVYSGSPSCWV